MTIEFYITDINLMECRPRECPEKGFSNQTMVKHFRFSGDGRDSTGLARDAPSEVVNEYIGYCERQVRLAKMYLRSIEGGE